MLGNTGNTIAPLAAILTAILAGGCGAENPVGGNLGAGAASGGDTSGADIIAQHDANGDNLLSMDEAPAEMKGEFGQYDSDGDGLLTSIEIDRGAQPPGPLAGMGGGPPAGSGGGGGYLGGAGGGLSESDTCASKEITTQPGIPKVDLVVDRSGSMNESASYDSKWVEACDAVRELVFPLTDQVAFGYHGYTYDVLGGGNCPNLVEVPAATGNAQPLWDTMLANPPIPLSSTPTAETLDAVYQQIIQERAAGDTSSRTILLITDGEPNGCLDFMVSGIQKTEEATERICQADIRFFNIWLGPPDPDVQAHMQRLADLGVGACKDPTMTGTFHTVNSRDELARVLAEVVTGVMECVLQLDGKGVNPQAACSDPRSTVTIGDERIACNDPNGYRLTGPTTLEFLGAACERLQSNQNLNVSAAFPCEVLIE